VQEEKKTLDRELARAKVTANRVATVVANEWKDGNDKVMPVKQWLEERKYYQVCSRFLPSASGFSFFVIIFFAYAFLFRNEFLLIILAFVDYHDLSVILRLWTYISVSNCL